MNFITDTIEEIKAMKPRSVSVPVAQVLTVCLFS